MPASEECERVLTNLTQRLTTQSTEKTVKDRQGLHVSRTKPNKAYREVELSAQERLKELSPPHR